MPEPRPKAAAYGSTRHKPAKASAVLDFNMSLIQDSLDS